MKEIPRATREQIARKMEESRSQVKKSLMATIAGGAWNVGRFKEKILGKKKTRIVSLTEMAMEIKESGYTPEEANEAIKFPEAVRRYIGEKRSFNYEEPRWLGLKKEKHTLAIRRLDGDQYDVTVD